MHILMLNNELPPLGGGMGTANLAILNQFSLLPEIKIDLITSAIGGKSEFTQFSENIQIYKVPVWNQNIHHSTNRELIFYFFQACVKSVLFHQRQHYDYCFAWSSVPAGAVALVLFFFSKLPYTVWVSGPDIPGFEHRYKRLYPLLTPILHMIWKYAHPLIAKCQEEVELIHKSRPDQAVIVIPNGVDIDYFYPFAKGNSRPSPLRVICVARLIERKGQNHLIQAIHRLAREGIFIEAYFLGTGDALKTYQELTQKLGIENLIHFMGYIPREELAPHLANADIFILPSFFEGLSLAALEGLGAGLPVILTRTGGTADLIHEGVNGFSYEWGDIDSLSVHLRWMHSHREQLPAMGKASRNIAENYSWSGIAKVYLDLLEKTIKGTA